MRVELERDPAPTAQFEGAKQDLGTPLNQLQNFISQKVDVIIVQAVDTDSTPKITQLAAIDTIIANNDEMALGAINALKAAKKFDGKVVVAGIDATGENMAQYATKN